MPIERQVVLFSGRVQGVGFRQTTVELARPYPLGGTVRNRPDGQVELIVEGTPDNIDALLAMLRRRFHGYITTEQKTVAPACGLKPPVRVAW